MKKILKTLFFLLLIGGLSTNAAPDETGISLTVQVKGAEPAQGQVILSVFTSPENFLKEAVISLIEPVNEEGAVVFTIDGLEPGAIAISAIHDADSDGKLKTGFMGIPKEMVGFSNAAKGRFGPPRFEKAAIQVSESGKIEIQLGRAKD